MAVMSNWIGGFCCESARMREVARTGGLGGGDGGFWLISGAGAVDVPGLGLGLGLWPGLGLGLGFGLKEGEGDGATLPLIGNGVNDGGDGGSPFALPPGGSGGEGGEGGLCAVAAATHASKRHASKAPRDAMEAAAAGLDGCHTFL